MTAIQRAIEIAGGQKPLAEAIGCTQPTIWYWLKKGQCSHRFVLAIERATGVSRQSLRPDLYPSDSEAA